MTHPPPQINPAPQEAKECEKEEIIHCYPESECEHTLDVKEGDDVSNCPSYDLVKYENVSKEDYGGETNEDVEVELLNLKVPHAREKLKFRALDTLFDPPEFVPCFHQPHNVVAKVERESFEVEMSSPTSFARELKWFEAHYSCTNVLSPNDRNSRTNFFQEGGVDVYRGFDNNSLQINLQRVEAHAKLSLLNFWLWLKMQGRFTGTTRNEGNIIKEAWQTPRGTKELWPPRRKDFRGQCLREGQVGSKDPHAKEDLVDFPHGNFNSCSRMKTTLAETITVELPFPRSSSFRGTIVTASTLGYTSSFREAPPGAMFPPRKVLTNFCSCWSRK